MPENKFPTYCRTGSPAGAVVTCTVSIYRQCSESLDQPGALIKRIKPGDQVGGSGVTRGGAAEYTEILTASSVKSRAKLFASNVEEFKVNVQNDAFNVIYDQMRYGLDFELDPDDANYSILTKGDQLGKLSPRFSVEFAYSSAGEELGSEWCPDCEIMMAGQAAMAAGQIYKFELTIMPQEFNDNGDRVIYRVPTKLVKGSVLPF